MKPVNYTALDLEMTGLSPKTDRIIEIGAWRIRDGKAEGSYGMLVNPHRSIPAKIRALTGISDEMVKTGCEPDEAVLGLLEFIGEDVIVGQNIIFDYGFLKQWATNHKRPLDLFACDTLKIARQLLPQEQPKNLEALCNYFCIMRQNAHRALDDARETAEVFEHLKELAGEQSDALFTPKQLQYKAKRQTPATPHQLEQLQNFRKQHEITDDIAWEGLTRSEASRIMDRYYASYGR